MKILIYTRSPESSSSITANHLSAAMERNEIGSLRYDLVLCHSETDLSEHLAAVDIVISSRADLCAYIRPAHRNIKLIFFAFSGVDHLAPFNWVPVGTYVVNNSGASGQAMSEYTLFALFALANGLVRCDASKCLASVAQCGFASLAYRSVTIVGVGGVGSSVAAMCKRFRMTVRGVRRSGDAAPNVDIMYAPSGLAAAIAESEFVIIACPVTAETRGLFSASMIARMRPGAFLINVARGAVVDEGAVCDAIERHALGGAILDVVSAAEPEARVRHTPGIIVTPHTSGNDRSDYIDNSLDVFTTNLVQLLAGKRPDNSIDPELQY